MFRYLMAFLSVSLLFASSCGQCDRDYVLTGVVTDSVYNPLPSVEVRWHSDDPNQPAFVFGLTDAQGRYNFVYSPFKEQLMGVQLEFVKTGYSVFVADPYNSSEAGPDICGRITLLRDAVLQP